MSKKEKPANDAAPAAEAAAPGSRRRMKFKNKLLLIISSLLLMAFLRTGFVFYIIGMLPSILVYYLDQSPHRYTFKTIFFCNLSGMLPFLGQLLRYGPSSAALQDIMGDPASWIIIYGSAAFGALLISITPLVAQTLIGRLHQTQVMRLQRAQKKIENEWGKEVTQFGVSNEAEA